MEYGVHKLKQYKNQTINLLGWWRVLDFERHITYFSGIKPYRGYLFALQSCNLIFYIRKVFGLVFQCQFHAIIEPYCIDFVEKYYIWIHLLKKMSKNISNGDDIFMDLYLKILVTISVYKYYYLCHSFFKSEASI